MTPAKELRALRNDAYKLLREGPLPHVEAIHQLAVLQDVDVRLTAVEDQLRLVNAAWTRREELHQLRSIDPELLDTVEIRLEAIRNGTKSTLELEPDDADKLLDAL